MKIKSITLKDFDRFALNHYPVFTYIPSQKIQLILGTNSSGKSSLLEQLSPLPAEKSDFKPNGNKSITIEHMGKTYLLKSEFKPAAVHSFYDMSDPDVNLNQGGTASVQKALVEKHFAITPDIHEVMIGKLKFTDMSVAKRREWFTRMSKIDFDYAIEVYQSLKNKLRETEQVLKFQQSTLLTEASKILDESSRKITEETLVTYKDLLDLLIAARDQINITPTADVEAQLDHAIASKANEYRRHLKALSKLGHALPTGQIDTHIQDVSDTLIATSSRYDTLGKYISQQQTLLKSFEDMGVRELKDLTDEQASIYQQIEQTQRSLRWFKPETDHDQAKTAVQLAYDGLYETLQSMPENTDRYFSKQNYQDKSERLKLLQTEVNGLKLQLEKTNQHIAEYRHAMEHQETTCPACKHVWIRGFDQVKYDAHVLNRMTWTKRIEELSMEISTIEKYLQDTTEYFNHYRTYVRVVDQLPVLSSIWDEATKQEIPFREPKSLLSLLESARYDLPSLIDLKRLKARYEDLGRMIKIHESTSGTDISKLKETYHQAMSEYETLHGEIDQHKARLSYFKSLQAQHQTLSTLRNELSELVDKREALASNNTNKHRYQILQSLIQKYNIEIGNLTQKLYTADTQSAVVEQIKATIAKLTVEKEAYTAMVNAMSPKDGLIARSISGFINHFVSQMNVILSEIWLYPVELLPINDTDADLDLNYRFEVQIKHQKVIPDIAKCSAGMQEAIDLAFRLVSMRYLGLDTMPIYLDEFGKSMDSAHRIKTFDAITKLILHSHYSQVFIISHYEHAYGGIANTDVTVLNPDNIVIPPGTVFNNVIEVQT